MLKQQQLLALTPRPVRLRAKNPRFRKRRDRVETKEGKTYRSLFLNCSLQNEDSTGTSYDLIIRNYSYPQRPKDFYFTPASKLWVHCSCPYFLYYVEVALTLQGSSSIYDSNGNMPRINNPKVVPYVCKHLFAALLMLQNRDKGKSRGLV